MMIDPPKLKLSATWAGGARFMVSLREGHVSYEVLLTYAEVRDAMAQIWQELQVVRDPADS